MAELPNIAYTLRILKQCILEWNASKRAVDRILHEVLRENHVGARQRHEISDALFALIRYWPLIVPAQFDPEKPASMRQLDDKIRAYLEGTLKLEQAHARAKPNCEQDMIEHMISVHGIPQFMRHELASDPAAWHEYLHASLCEAPLSVRANTLKNTREALMKELELYSPQSSALSSDAILLPLRSPVRQHPALAEGRAELQDEHSQMVAPFLNPQAGERVLDLCAGAGGKSLHLAALMQGKGEVVATDIDVKKLTRLKERARAAGATNIRALPLEEVRGEFDAILIDSPCSGFGTLRRNPERLYTFSEREARELEATQRALLHRAISLLKPNGRVLYATCSVRHTENEAILAEAPQNLKLDRMANLRPRQNSTGGDGFFMALLRKVPET